MTKIGILKNQFHPTGWNNCDWTNSMIRVINKNNHELHLIDNHTQVDSNVAFYLTRLNHDAGNKNSEMLSKKLEDIALNFEKKGSLLIPHSYWYRLYENKKNIFKLFDNCSINKPKTYFFNSLDQALSEQVQLPVVIKHPYSCASNYMSQAFTRNEYETEIKKIFSVSSECIVQQKISFTKEARITFVGDKAIHGYYRIKKDKESLSGSTRFGSICDFNIDLEHMSKHIEKFRKATNINIAAVDVAWSDDNLNSEPYYFEVSPIFSMNVPGPVGSAYKRFKGTPEFKQKERIIQDNYYSNVIKFMLNKQAKPIVYCDIDETINTHIPRVRKWAKNGFIDPQYGSYDEIMNDEPIIEAREILNNLKDKYNIVFITARSKFNNAYISTRDWLIKNNFHYDKIIITKNFEEKLEIMKKDNNIHLFIDDLTRGHHTDNIEVKKECIKKLIYHNIPFVRYNNNWNEIKELL